MFKQQKLVKVFSFLLPVSLLLLAACSLSPSSLSTAEPTVNNPLQPLSTEQIYWVNSSPSSCVGVVPMSCLQIQKVESHKPIIRLDGWQNFYAGIIGFDYQPGFIYQIKVKEEVIPRQLVAADAASLRYTLVEIIDKQTDEASLLQGAWQLARIKGKPVSVTALNTKPQLEINLNTMRLSGTDSCNRLMASIVNIKQSDIEFSAIALTRRYCSDMALANVFNDALTNVKFYRIDAGALVFEDAQRVDLLSFIKPVKG